MTCQTTTGSIHTESHTPIPRCRTARQPDRQIEKVQGEYTPLSQIPSIATTSNDAGVHELVYTEFLTPSPLTNNPGVHLRPHLGPTDNSNSSHMRLLVYLSFIPPKPTSEVTQEKIEQACRNANILDFVNSLPKLVLFLSFFRVIS